MLYEITVNIEADGLRDAQEKAEAISGYVETVDGPNEVETEPEEIEDEVAE